MSTIACPGCGQKLPSTVLICPSCHSSTTAPSAPATPLLNSNATPRALPSGSWTGSAPAEAGLWRRFFALLIDVFALGLVSIAAMSVLPAIGSLLAGWAYFAGFETSPWQATPGKRLLGIRVVDVNGVPLRAGRASLRYLCRFLSALPLGGGYIMAAFTQHRQALHDLLAGTRVVMR